MFKLSPKKSVLEIASFYSELHEYNDVKQYLDDFVSVLDKSGLIEYYKGVFTGDKLVVFNAENLVLFGATGGVSTALFEAASRARNVYLVYHEEHNSLASVLNTAQMLRQQGVKTSQISLEEFSKLAPKLHVSAKAVESLHGLDIIVVGDIPRWAKRSGTRELIESQFGVKVRVVGFEQLGDWVEKYASHSKELASEVTSEALFSTISQEDVIKASAFYYALKELSNNTGSRVLAVKCFDMLENYGVTGCLGLAEFTKRDGIATCEADLHASVVMWILKKLSGRDPWMGNVSRVTPGELELSHCTISRNITRGYGLKTHFESNLPLAIEGYIEPGQDATIVAYNSARRLWRVIKGRVLKGEPSSSKKCRTQVLFKVPVEATKEILEDPIEGHYVAVFTDVFNEAVLAGELAGLNVQAFKFKSTINGVNFS